MYLHKTPKAVKRYFKSLTWARPSGSDTIYLTFDDGPVPGLTPYILEELKIAKAKATFFCVGDNIRKHPEIFNEVVAAGNSFGNHTYNHLNGWKTGTEEYIENVWRCEKAIAKTGYSRLRKLFRPPYGMIKPAQIKRLSEDYDIIMWEVLSGDFDMTINPDQCLKRSIDATQDGSIVVFHDNYKAERTVKYVLPRYLNHFSEKGFTFAAL